jgi:enoyl-CoA hydratase/carnithine racemase
MGCKNILTDIGDDYVAEIILNRPKQLSAFNSAMADKLDSTLLEFYANRNVRVILL